LRLNEEEESGRGSDGAVGIFYSWAIILGMEINPPFC